MTTYIEQLLRYLMPHGNWGQENPASGPQSHVWGQTFVHLFLGAILPLIALPIVAWWPLCGFSAALLIGLLVPIYREFINDKHPISDIYNNTPAGIDCRSDLLSCYVGSCLSLIPMGILTCLILFI